MSSYAPYHPKWYRPRMSVWWWLKKRSYALFVVREISSVFVALFAALTLFEVRSLAAGPEAHARLRAWLETPLALLLNAVILALVLYHAVTWFNLAPKALVVRLGGRRLPAAAVAGANYAAWLIASAAVAFFLLRA